MKKLNGLLTVLILASACVATTACNKTVPTNTDTSTKGLSYTAIDGKDEYKLSGIGTADSATEIVIASTYKGKPVTEISANVFKNNTTITKVQIPNGIKTIGNNAFQGCTALTEITLPASVTALGEKVFFECTSVTEITVAEANTAYQSINGNLYSKDGSILVQYALGDIATSYTTPQTVVTIANGACSRANNLETVVVGASVKTVSDSAFRACNKLSDLTLSNGVQEIGTSAFAGCFALKSIIIPISVVKMSDNVFYDTADAIIGNSDLVIYCEADRPQSGWKSSWNYVFPAPLPVEWGYTADEE